MLRIMMIPLALLACAPVMTNPDKTQAEAKTDAQYCMSKAVGYANPGIGSRLAAYEACMMEMGYKTQ